ncbi:MAG: type II toxin-antitoxin system CcdA family antitoxin [Sulfurimonas sp.]|nr:type II toxin-antitoxin system CcdA family antitoxin [Sulfurimonas sp.]
MKKHVTITISDFIYDKAKARGINISMICEDALRTILGSFNKEIKSSTCNHDWTWAFATPMGLYKECKRCGVFKRVYVEKTK